MNQNGKVFYDKLTYIYLEMPNFLKKENELATHLDKWLYFIKNLNNLNDIPLIFTKDVVFMEAFNKAKLSGLSQDEYASYINSIKGYNDWMSVMDTKLEEAELRIKRDLAKSLKSNGVTLEIIQKTTQLSFEDIQNL